MFGRELEELLLRLSLRISSGSPGCRPLARANRLRTSVKLTTPESRPLMAAPGSCEALIVTPGLMLVKGGPGVMSDPAVLFGGEAM